MGIAIAIVAGLSVMTLIAAGFDFLTKRSKNLNKDDLKRMGDLETRIAALEQGALLKDELIKRLQDDLSFYGKLLEDGRNKE